MFDGDVRALNLDVYDTREGLWNPEHGSVDLPEGWEFLAAGDTFVTRRVKAAGTVRGSHAGGTVRIAASSACSHRRL